MMLSKESIVALIDLIENKLAMMAISDCDDLREKIQMQRALSELRGVSPDAVLVKNLGELHRRGRRRKVSAVLNDQQETRTQPIIREDSHDSSTQ